VAHSIRCALAEAVIAQEMSRHIFQKFYIPDEATGVMAMTRDGRRA